MKYYFTYIIKKIDSFDLVRYLLYLSYRKMLRTSIIEEITEIVGIPPSLNKRLKRECNLMKE